MNALLALVRKDLVLYFSNKRALAITLAAPILIAVLTAFLTMEGIRYFLTRRQRPSAATAGERHPAPDQPADGQ